MDVQGNLGELLSEDQPFGPNASDNISDRLYEEIFSRENSAFASLKTRPFLIVGRRGAGKTAILSAIRNSARFGIVAEIPSDQTFQEIIDNIDKSTAEQTLPETVSRVWEKLLWTVIFTEVSSRFVTSFPAESAIVEAYLAKIGVKKRAFLNK